MTGIAKGTFEVTVKPEEQSGGPEGGWPTARYALSKIFIGDLAGQATGTMLSAGIPKAGNSAVYVAVDQFTGVVEGREGGFVLLHRGVMTRAGGRTLEVVVAEDSGNGELEGISGKLDIDIRDGKHYYTFEYSLD